MNVEYQHREERRRSKRKRRAETQSCHATSKSKKFSGDITSANHDEGKKLKMKVGIDLLEQERKYDPEVI